MSVPGTQEAVVKLHWWERVWGRGFLLKELVLQVLKFGCGMLRGGGDAVEWREDGKKFHSGERTVRNSILKLASQG